MVCTMLPFLAVFYLPNFSLNGKEAYMNKQTLAAIIAVIVLGLGGLGWYASSQDSGSSEGEASQTSESVEQSTSISINISDDGTSVSYSGVSEETALDTLKNLTSVETESSDFGEFVTTISSVEADSTSEYWAFYVNGELASEGAGAYVSQPGDMIEWKLESF